MNRLLALAIAGLFAGLPSPAPAADRKEDPARAEKLAAAIDGAIAGRLAKEKLTASPLADDAEFLRRVYLDLTGRIPSAEKARAFLDSKEPRKRARLIERLLASKEYGQHAGAVWRDLMVRPDANMLRPPDTTPLINWLAEQFNSNRGWNQIVHDLLTVEGAKPQGIFYVLNGDSRGHPQANVLAGSVGQLFMGVQLACAECHNHPFVDDWKQTDFWGLAAFFGRVNATGGLRAKFGGQNITENTIAKVVGKKKNAAPKAGPGASIIIPDSAFKQIGKRVNARLPHGDEPKLALNKPFRPVLASWLTSKDNPYFARNAVNRLWAQLLGKGFVNPPGEMSSVNPPSHPELFDALAREFVAADFDLKFLIRGIMLSQTYQRTSRPVAGNKVEEPLFARQQVKVLAPEVLYNALTQALEVDSLLPPTTRVGGGKKKKANKKFPPASAKQQFINFFTTKDVEGDATEFTHGIPQALRLMNQELFNTGGNTLKRLLAAPGSPQKVIEGIYLAVLSRRPSPIEARELLDHVAKQKEPRTGYRDVFWALINSAEFSINR